MRAFLEGQFFGFDLGLFVTGGSLDLGFFEDLAGFLFGVLLTQVAEQLDDAHAHERGDQRDATISHGLVGRSAGCWANTR